jgi:nucleoside-diphosphate-sugar epimerase
MHILITGAAGMIGAKFLQRLARDPGALGRPVTRLTLADAYPAAAPDGLAAAVEVRVGDLADTGAAAALIAGRPDLVVHLAAVVSGEAEADFEKGYRVNVTGLTALLEEIRAANVAEGYRPRFIYASSIAVHGAPFPERLDDDVAPAPLTSYGTQKAIGELLLADYSRRGIVDGIGLRFPTIVIRPGAPNKAASGFFSGILREPLAGKEAVLPVADTVRHWFASPRSAAGFLVHAATIDLAPLGQKRTLTMPGLSATVAEEIEALRRFAGEAAVALIRREPDPAVARIVAGWPERLDARRAESLGFSADRSFDDIIRAHVDDEGIGAA